jgi:hypothetical protein
MYKIHATKACRERGSIATIILKIESSAFGCCGCDHGSRPTHGGCVGFIAGLVSHGEKENLCSCWKLNCTFWQVLNRIIAR